MNIVHLSPRKFIAGCAAVAIAILLIGQPLPASVIASEVLITVVALFVFGSIRYQLNKNALTYGAALVICATFASSWWPNSDLRSSLQAEGASALWPFLRHHVLSFRGLDHLIHIDTMLFILGLTFFVAVIAQTRILESVSFAILRRTKGQVFLTVALLAAIVSFASGILDGVSMIGLLIRTLVIIILLSKTNGSALVFTVIISTVITTVCGMWLAYGEPPNLIMKSNLHPHLDDAFFLRYCLPVAVASLMIVLWNLRRFLKGRVVRMDDLDVLDRHTADVRFLQAARHGHVPSAIEFVEMQEPALHKWHGGVLNRLSAGEPLGRAMVLENVPPQIRKELLAAYVSTDIAEPLDEHYSAGHASSGASLRKVSAALEKVQTQRLAAQKIGALSFVPFVALLAWHAIDHDVPLFWASFAAFGVAFLAIRRHARIRALALHDARHEYSEYLFLFPLFLSISLLQKSGFFDQISALLLAGVEQLGLSIVALVQFFGATLLSALLDNNVVADFAGRALRGLELGTLHLFAMAQIAGYAAGGCWTHIGSAQSVVAYSFIRKEIAPGYTPFQWIKAMTPVILQISVVMVAIIYIEAYLTTAAGR